MNQYEAETAIAQQWMSAWPALALASFGSAVPFVFDNDVIDETAAYARVKIFGGPSDRITIGGLAGSRRVERSGFVNVLLKTPANAGRKAATKLVGAVRSTLELVRLGAVGTELGVVMEEASPSRDSSDGQFWVVVVTVPFHYYETV